MGKKTIILLFLFIILVLIFLIMNTNLFNNKIIDTNINNEKNVNIYENTSNTSIKQIDNSLDDLASSISNIDDINDSDLVIPQE